MAVVEVWTRTVQMGHFDELAEAIVGELKRFKPPEGTPTYRSWKVYSSAANSLVMTMEWDSLADREKWWAAWGADPGSSAHMEKWNRWVLPGGTDVLWYLQAEVCGEC